MNLLLESFHLGAKYAASQAKLPGPTHTGSESQAKTLLTFRSYQG